MVLDGRGGSLYDLALQEEYQRRLVPERAAEGELMAFVNPPHAALFLAPLGLLPRETSFYVWAMLQLGMLVLLLRWLLEIVPEWGPGERVLLVLTVAAFPPLFMSFQLGQVSLAGLLCLTGFYRALRRGESWQGAAWLILGTFKPQLMLVPTVILLAGRRWRALGVGGWLLRRVGERHDGGDGLGVLDRFPGDHAAQRPAIRDVLHLSGADGQPERFSHGADRRGQRGPRQWPDLRRTLARAAGGGLALRGPCGTESPGFEARFALSVQLSLVFNPHFNPADAVCFVLPLLLFLLALQRGGRPARGWAALVLACPLLFALDAFAPIAWPGHVRPFFLVMAAALAWMVLRVAGGLARACAGHTAPRWAASLRITAAEAVRRLGEEYPRCSARSSIANS